MPIIIVVSLLVFDLWLLLV